MNKYLKTNSTHFLVDPDENLIYTKCKCRLLCQGNGSEGLPEATGGCDSSSPSGTDTDLNNARIVAFPVDGLGTSLSKSSMFTRVELEKHIKNLGEKHQQNNENHSLPTGLRKAKAFLADEYLHKVKQTATRGIFIFTLNASTVFKAHDELHNLKFAVSIVSGDVDSKGKEVLYCKPLISHARISPIKLHIEIS